jgi:hypothetical protein
VYPWILAEALDNTRDNIKVAECMEGKIHSKVKYMALKFHDRYYNCRITVQFPPYMSFRIKVFRSLLIPFTVGIKAAANFT